MTPKIIGISKVRNESNIIEDAIKHYLQWCEMLVIYDDCSDDNTVELMKKFDRVIVIKGEKWEPENREELEGEHRQIALDEAMKHNPDWICVFDPDEVIVDFPKNLEGRQAIEMTLFDCYITPVDVLLNYKDRRFFGPEYREIINLIRADRIEGFLGIDQRIPNLKPMTQIRKGEGFIKHYGKGISVKEWEDTCKYYSTYFKEPYKTKWEARKGKAIHFSTDFGSPLFDWDNLIKDTSVWRPI